MELFHEEKKKILEEEQRRLAEECYRRQVRSELAGGHQAATGTDNRSPRKSPLIVVLALVAVCGGWFITRDVLMRSDTSAASLLRPFRQSLFSAEFVVEAAQYSYQTFTVDHAVMINPRVEAVFTHPAEWEMTSKSSWPRRENSRIGSTVIRLTCSIQLTKSRTAKST